MTQNSSNKEIIHKRIESNSILNNLFIFDQTIGKGTFGTVFKAFSQRTQSDVAIKIVHKEKAGSKGVDLLEHEIEILKIIDHSNLIRLHEVYETGQQVFLVMELCNRGQLAEMLKARDHLEEFEVRHVLKQLANALTYLHKMDIVHRDIKLENILIKEKQDEEFNFMIKITDFGLAVKISGVTADHMLHEFCGTPIYMAPEMVRKHSYSTLCDVWAMGIIAYALIEGNQPFSFNSQGQLYKLIKNGEINYKSPRFKKISFHGVKCIQGMLEINPAHRMSASEILNSGWITGNARNSERINVLEMMKQYKENEMSDPSDCDLPKQEQDHSKAEKGHPNNKAPKCKKKLKKDGAL